MMNTIFVKDIIDALSAAAPPAWQESYDNCGLQTGRPGMPVQGVLLTVDVTEDVVEEAAACGANLIVAHHPLIFNGLKHLCGQTAVERTVELALKRDVAVCAFHTSMDKAPCGVSRRMASKFGLRDVETLVPEQPSGVGLGVTGRLEQPCPPAVFASRLKDVFGTPVLRCTRLPGHDVSRIALCGGSGAEFWRQAAASGCDVLVTSDVKYHVMMDAAPCLWLVDVGHYESEQYTKEIFYEIITEKFSNIAVRFSCVNTNPVNYL